MVNGGGTEVTCADVCADATQPRAPISAALGPEAATFSTEHALTFEETKRQHVTLPIANAVVTFAEDSVAEHTARERPSATKSRQKSRAHVRVRMLSPKPRAEREPR